MGKKGKKGGGAAIKIKKTSGGRRRMVRAKLALMRITMKIARWKRNKENSEKVSRWDRKQNVRLRPRHNKWNIDGLVRHVTVLQNIIDKGLKVAVR